MPPAAEANRTGGLTVAGGHLPRRRRELQRGECLLFRGGSLIVIAVATAMAAGGALAMATETMIAEGFHRAPRFSGIVIALGFMAAFLLGRAFTS